MIQMNKPREKQGEKRTDDGEVDAAITRGRLLEVDAAAVETGVHFTDIIDAQSGRMMDRVEESPPAQCVLIRPVARTAGKTVPRVVPNSFLGSISFKNYYFNTILLKY